MRQPDERVLQKQAIGLFYLLIIHILAIILREDLFLAFFLRRPLVVHPIRTTPGTGMMPPRLRRGSFPPKKTFSMVLKMEKPIKKSNKTNKKNIKNKNLNISNDLEKSFHIK